MIGAGSIATSTHLPVLLAQRETTVAYVADRSRSAAERAARIHGCRPVVVGTDGEGLPVTDVALLSIPVGARLPYYEALSRRRTAIYAEKPVATSVRGAQRLRELFPADRFACGFQRRFYDSFEILRLATERRWFGRLHRVAVQAGSRAAATRTDFEFRDDISQSGGGILMDLGCHFADLVYHVTGASEAKLMTHRLLFDGDVDREADLELELPTPDGDVHVTLTLSWLRQLDDEFQLDFDMCSLRTSTRPGAPVEVLDRRGERSALLQHPRPCVTTVNRAIHSAWQSLLDSLRSGTPCQLRVESCLPTIDLIERVYDRARCE